MDKILSALRTSGRAAFRTREYASLLGKGTYASIVLHRLKEKGIIRLIKRGWWAFGDAMPEAVACEISKPAYISFHSALFLHWMTTQMPMAVQIAVSRNARHYTVEETKVREYKIKKKHFNNFYRKESLLLASPEKAFADCLGLPRSCPAFILAEAFPNINLEKLRQLLWSAAAEKRLKQVMKNARQR